MEYAVSTEAVFEKLWMMEMEAVSESVKALIYFDVHDAVLAAVELDATLRQQVG